LVNALCKEPLNQLLNYFLPTLKLGRKEGWAAAWCASTGQRGRAAPSRGMRGSAGGNPSALKNRKQNLNPFALR
jgi:hypothetical protein